jgi:cytochrome bd ubiquinol oxidase subunit II
METIWFSFLAFMIAMYVVLDGFDLGVGALHLLVGRTDEERSQSVETIGPIWNGNEVWLIAAGGVLFMIFPKIYAAAFSGLYFGLILVLWLLVGRGLGLELRHQVDNRLWRDACDTVFGLSSAALAFVFGVALGNVVRGVPLNADGYFHLPLFEILNWYAVLIGVFGVVALATHGALFLAFRAPGVPAERARRWSRHLLWGEAALFVAMIAPTYAVREQMLTNLVDHPWRLVFPLLAASALVAVFVYRRRRRWGRAFLASSGFIAGLLATAAAGLYPAMLPAREGQPHSLTIHNGIAGDTVLNTAVIWWPLALLLAAFYFSLAYRMIIRPAQNQSSRSRVTSTGQGA